MLKIREEELNMITGGDLLETEEDSAALRAAGYMEHEYSVGHLMFNWISDSAQVDAGWKKAGITSVTKPFGANRYYKDGKEISEDLALFMIGW